MTASSAEGVERHKMFLMLNFFTRKKQLKSWVQGAIVERNFQEIHPGVVWRDNLCFITIFCVLTIFAYYSHFKCVLTIICYMYSFTNVNLLMQQRSREASLNLLTIDQVFLRGQFHKIILEFKIPKLVFITPFFWHLKCHFFGV